ncbi:flavoprotein oxidoreductase [Paractinoplanes abujensis]|uniref:NADPH-dependent 2,4-dienoyl-CoA reductase/sulfur reductase-like enzyme n=1 Tax=Paractinoplanes abujensis TaxID=882441 RepID=A0A7W7G7H8_9ACTN|nr:FAD-dependent oxidoreductase [Actinoplanes abujensis]MBB4697016.1 NADPH-dependent 2,4-dienoyl-CoA reductase/sulfur reductase-like enzyme [Actinoplanes abujensis]GID18510.1 flavoprotein oxidoreductase [Actinoplanes abujensis]
MRLVVIGGDAAGMSAASQARKRLGQDDLAITVFERGHFTSYSACGIPYWIGGAVTDRDKLVARTPEQHRQAGVDVRLRHEVVGIDLDRREVVAHDLAGGGETREPFDHLVYATGASPFAPEWARVRDAGVFGVQTLDDGQAIHDWLDREPAPRRAVVIGGGYIGVEMAEAMVLRGLEVTLLEKSPQPMAKTVDPEMGALVQKSMRGLGIEVVTGAHVEGLETAGGRVRAVVTPDGTLPADIVVLGLGVRPNVALAADAGLPVGPAGGVRTDLRMRVEGAEGVWAAGDCVETRHLLTGRPVHVPLGTHANKQGRVAGINIGGGYATFPGVIGTAVTKVCDLEVARTGLTSKEAHAAGFSFVTATVDSTSRAGYYPGAETMTIKLIAERRTGVLLGAQIVGRAEAAKRIDALAVAIWNKMTVEEMTSLDLSYAPPFAPVWDPVLIAARKATEAVHASL